MLVSMMRIHVSCLLDTNIHDSCSHDASVNDECSHDAYAHDTCIYDAYFYVPRSLTLICVMHISMILHLDPEACTYNNAYIYDAANLSPTDGRTDGRTRRF